MKVLHALRAERGQLLLTASAHASAYPPGGFNDIGKYELSYIIKNGVLNHFLVQRPIIITILLSPLPAVPLVPLYIAA